MGQEQEDIARALCTRYGGSEFQFKVDANEREELWKVRKAALFASKVAVVILLVSFIAFVHASKELRPGVEVWTTDVCVPISRLAECIVETKKDIDSSFLYAPIVGVAASSFLCNSHVKVMLEMEIFISSFYSIRKIPKTSLRV